MDIRIKIGAGAMTDIAVEKASRRGMDEAKVEISSYSFRGTAEETRKHIAELAHAEKLASMLEAGQDELAIKSAKYHGFHVQVWE